jgi:hypothetical protein
MASTEQGSPHSEEIREIWKLFRETDRRFRESEREFRESMRILAERFKETDRRFQRTEQLVSKLTGKWGRFVEGIVAPAAIQMFKDRGIRIERIYQRVKAFEDNEGMEIDILGIDDTDVLAIEVKSTLSIDDVKEHLERLEKFRRFFPEYADKQLVGAVAGIVIEENSDRFAYKKGMFVIGQSGESVRILNDEKFVPKRW